MKIDKRVMFFLLNDDSQGLTWLKGLKLWLKHSNLRRQISLELTNYINLTHTAGSQFSKLRQKKRRSQTRIREVDFREQNYFGRFTLLPIRQSDNKNHQYKSISISKLETKKNSTGNESNNNSLI